MESFSSGGKGQMNIDISCELYARLSAIPLLLDPMEGRKYLKSLFFERNNGNLYAVATNVKLAAIEYLGKNDGPDECTAIVIDQALIDQCKREIACNGRMSIVANPLLNYTSIKTTFGFVCPGNDMVQLPEMSNFNQWREWFPDSIPKKNHGAMYWTTSLIHALATTSPTGGLRVPEHIDTTRPVVVRDQESANWAGLIMPIPLDENATVEPATIPEWL